MHKETQGNFGNIVSPPPQDLHIFFFPHTGDSFPPESPNVSSASGI